MTNIEVHENVLSEEHWKHLHDFISNEWFSWTYQLGTSHNDETGKYDRVCESSIRFRRMQIQAPCNAPCQKSVLVAAMR